MKTFILFYVDGFISDHYEALAHFVDLMRRAGKLDELPKFFELAESMTGGRSLIDAGFNYCRGLQEW